MDHFKSFEHIYIYPLPAALTRGMSLCSVSFDSFMLNASTRSRKLVEDSSLAFFDSISAFFALKRFCASVKCTSGPVLAVSSSKRFLLFMFTVVDTLLLLLAFVLVVELPFSFNFPPITTGLEDISTRYWRSKLTAQMFQFWSKSAFEL
jgi:hypothetical protein